MRQRRERISSRATSWKRIRGGRRVPQDAGALQSPVDTDGRRPHDRPAETAFAIGLTKGPDMRNRMLAAVAAFALIGLCGTLTQAQGGGQRGAGAAAPAV